MSGMNLSGERGGNMFDLCHYPYLRNDIRANCQHKAKQIFPQAAKCFYEKLMTWRDINLVNVIHPSTQSFEDGPLATGREALDTRVLQRLGQSNYRRQ